MQVVSFQNANLSMYIAVIFIQVHKGMQKMGLEEEIARDRDGVCGVCPQ